MYFNKYLKIKKKYIDTKNHIIYHLGGGLVKCHTYGFNKAKSCRINNIDHTCVKYSGQNLNNYKNYVCKVLDRYKFKKCKKSENSKKPDYICNIDRKIYNPYPKFDTIFSDIFVKDSKFIKGKKIITPKYQDRLIEKVCTMASWRIHKYYNYILKYLGFNNFDYLGHCRIYLQFKKEFNNSMDKNIQYSFLRSTSENYNDPHIFYHDMNFKYDKSKTYYWHMLDIFISYNMDEIFRINKNKLSSKKINLNKLNKLSDLYSDENFISLSDEEKNYEKYYIFFDLIDQMESTIMHRVAAFIDIEAKKIYIIDTEKYFRAKILINGLKKFYQEKFPQFKDFDIDVNVATAYIQKTGVCQTISPTIAFLALLNGGNLAEIMNGLTGIKMKIDRPPKLKYSYEKKVPEKEQKIRKWMEKSYVNFPGQKIIDGILTDVMLNALHFYNKIVENDETRNKVIVGDYQLDNVFYDINYKYKEVSENKYRDKFWLTEKKEYPDIF